MVLYILPFLGGLLGLLPRVVSTVTGVVNAVQTVRSAVETIAGPPPKEEEFEEEEEEPEEEEEEEEEEFASALAPAVLPGAGIRPPIVSQVQRIPRGIGRLEML